MGAKKIAISDLLIIKNELPGLPLCEGITK
jgi:hypothetical protein